MFSTVHNVSKNYLRIQLSSDYLLFEVIPKSNWSLIYLLFDDYSRIQLFLTTLLIVPVKVSLYPSSVNVSVLTIKGPSSGKINVQAAFLKNSHRVLVKVD